MSQFDHYGRPLREVFASRADLTPYTPLVSSISLDEKNPPRTRSAMQSAALDFEGEDRADDARFNAILWRVIKGPNVPYPGPTYDPRYFMEEMARR